MDNPFVERLCAVERANRRWKIFALVLLLIVGLLIGLWSAVSIQFISSNRYWQEQSRRSQLETEQQQLRAEIERLRRAEAKQAADARKLREELEQVRAERGQGERP
jgi:uncharacterized protein YlxW (UPF0749 family)